MAMNNDVKSQLVGIIHSILTTALLPVPWPLHCCPHLDHCMAALILTTALLASPWPLHCCPYFDHSIVVLTLTTALLSSPWLHHSCPHLDHTQVDGVAALLNPVGVGQVLEHWPYVVHVGHGHVQRDRPSQTFVVLSGDHLEGQRWSDGNNRESMGWVMKEKGNGMTNRGAG